MLAAGRARRARARTTHANVYAVRPPTSHATVRRAPFLKTRWCLSRPLLPSTSLRSTVNRNALESHRANCAMAWPPFSLSETPDGTLLPATPRGFGSKRHSIIGRRLAQPAFQKRRYFHASSTVKKNTTIRNRFWSFAWPACPPARRRSGSEPGRAAFDDVAQASPRVHIPAWDTPNPASSDCPAGLVTARPPPSGQARQHASAERHRHLFAISYHGATKQMTRRPTATK